jgi:carbonic anhydrase
MIGNTCCRDLLEGKPYKNLLVIGQVIVNGNEPLRNLTKMQVNVPYKYFEYDGSLTDGIFSPVRWIVDERPIRLNMRNVYPVCKSARPLQDLNGRIILFSNERTERYDYK